MSTPRPIGEIIKDYLQSSDEPLAKAFREQFPDSELLKSEKDTTKNENSHD